MKWRISDFGVNSRTFGETFSTQLLSIEKIISFVNCSVVKMFFFKFRFDNPQILRRSVCDCVISNFVFFNQQQWLMDLLLAFFFFFWFVYTDIGINIKYAQKYIIVFCLVFQYYSCVWICLSVCARHFRARSPLQINHYIYTRIWPTCEAWRVFVSFCCGKDT